MLASALLLGKDSEPMRVAATAIERYCSTNPRVFAVVSRRIGEAMEIIANALTNLWDDDRYLRAEGAYVPLAK